MRVEPAPASGIEDLRLRPIALADVDAWYAYLSRPQATEQTSWNLRGRDDLTALVKWYDADDPESGIRFAIVREADDRLVGTIGFHTISAPNCSAEIAYDVDPAFWGRGIATACCRAVTAWGFAARGWVRIQATVLETNTASLRVLEKCGFLLEGRLRSYRIVRGRPRDFLMLAAVARTGEKP